MRTVRRKISKSVYAMMIALFMCTIIITSVRMNTLKNESNMLAVTEQSLVAELEMQNETTAQLKEKQDYMKTKQYVEEVARDKLHLVYPYEIVIKPKDK